MNRTLKLIVLGSLLSGMTGVVTAEQRHEQHEQHEQHEHGHLEHFQAENPHKESASHYEHAKPHGDYDESKKHDEHGDAHDEHGDSKKHDESADAHGGHEEGVALSPKQMALANIKVAVLVARTMDYRIYAPGEIKTNGYTSYQVSPRVDSVVVRRHVSLGDHVNTGQALVTLFSESVAEAQAVFLIASSEWKRVKKMGHNVVSDKRYIATQTDYEAAYGRLLAFGLTKEAILSLKSKSHSLGEYTLIAASSGAVQSDDFRQGQRVESGQYLMTLADEKVLWVEAHLAPAAQLELHRGTQAKVKVGSNWYTAKVIQEAHTIDPITRTRVVRLQIHNVAHQLHPGLFADVYFTFVTEKPVLAVPEAALMRGADGDWTVFVEAEKGQFKAQEVELGRSLGKWREILGIHSGARIVMEGAFFVASQIAKGSFDPHNH